jgi:TctA family transporter
LQYWFLLWGAFAIVWFIIAILIAVWVYRDAEKRGESGVLWLIVVLITGIIGLIIWLIIRRDKPVVS